MDMIINDYQIRSSLRAKLQDENPSDSLIIDELGICRGDARIDMAVVNGSLHGYEIKSEVDTLYRLQRQMEIYSRVLDTITLVTTEKHLNESLHIIPEWWGVKIMAIVGESLCVESYRVVEQNQFIDPLSLVQLLWKEETLAILDALEVPGRKKSLPKLILWELLVNQLPLSDIQRIVRSTLKTRENWKSGKP